MNEISVIIESFSLDKFKKLVDLIIKMRGQTDSVMKNNKNGYFRATDHDANLHICRHLLDQAPERPKETEQALMEILYELKESGAAFQFKERKILGHESGKPKNEITVFGVQFAKRFYGGGGLQTHESIAFVMLLLYSAVKEYYSPSPADQKYIDEYMSLYEKLKKESENKSQEGVFCKKGLHLIDIIIDKKKNAWSNKKSLSNS